MNTDTETQTYLMCQNLGVEFLNPYDDSEADKTYWSTKTRADFYNLLREYNNIHWELKYPDVYNRIELEHKLEQICMKLFKYRKITNIEQQEMWQDLELVTSLNKNDAYYEELVDVYDNEIVNGYHFVKQDYENIVKEEVFYHMVHMWNETVQLGYTGIERFDTFVKDFSKLPPEWTWYGMDEYGNENENQTEQESMTNLLNNVTKLFALPYPKNILLYVSHCIPDMICVSFVSSLMVWFTRKCEKMGISLEKYYPVT